MNEKNVTPSSYKPYSSDVPPPPGEPDRHEQRRAALGELLARTRALVARYEAAMGNRPHRHHRQPRWSVSRAAQEHAPAGGVELYRALVGLSDEYRMRAVAERDFD